MHSFSLTVATALVQNELNTVNQTILQSLDSPIARIGEVAAYLIQSGGKQIRPLLLLLMSKACGQDSARAIQCAAIIELIHSATLLHDDVIDNSLVRRGKASAKSLWGNSTSILVGDFLHARAFQLINQLHDFTIHDIIAHSTRIVVEGELMQLLHQYNPEITQEAYQQMIDAKSAQLFETAALLGGLHSAYQGLGEYGKQVGRAFQLIDDLMDYQATPDSMGKEPGDDLKEGKMTLPLIAALKHASADQSVLIKTAIREGNLEYLAQIQAIIVDTGARDYVLQQADRAMALALTSLSGLPDSVYKTALNDLARFSARRMITV